MEYERPRRVLFLNHNVVEEGTFLRCQGLARGLAAQGVEVAISCTDSRKGLGPVRERADAPGVRVRLLPEIADTPSYLGCAWRTLLNLRELRGRFDVVHAFAVAIPSTGIPALASRLLPGSGLFVDWDDRWGDGLGKHLPGPAHRLVRFLEKEVLRRGRPRGVTVVSPALQEAAAAAGIPPGRIRIIPNGSPCRERSTVKTAAARRELDVWEEGEVLVSMGRMFDESLDLLLNAFALILKKRPRSRLFVVGDLCRYGGLGRLTAAIKARHSSLGDRVVFTGGCRGRTLDAWLAAADVLVLPLMDTDSDRSRFPMRFGDYLASGRPLAVSAVGEIGRLTREHACGETAAPGDPEALASAVERLLIDPRR
ncbi:MAG TPA: glycosyltransferase, partial [bacterium]|nr:glycosyltransferase [bacterium]